MIAMSQATAALYIRKFTKYLVNLIDIYLFSKSKQRNKSLTVCEIFFKLKFSKFVQNFRTINVFGKFLLIGIFCVSIVNM